MWHVVEERGCIGSYWGNRGERDHWGDLGVDGWIILGWISGRWNVGIWTGLSGPRIDRWRTFVSAVMNLRVAWNAGNFLTSCKPVSFSRRTLHRGVSMLKNWHCCLKRRPKETNIFRVLHMASAFVSYLNVAHETLISGRIYSAWTRSRYSFNVNED